MKRYNFALAAILTSVAMLPALASATPSIIGAAPNYTTNQLTITGTGFGSGLPVVKLDSISTTVVSHTSTLVVIDLPGTMSAGTYLAPAARKAPPVRKAHRVRPERKVPPVRKVLPARKAHRVPRVPPVRPASASDTTPIN
jgi:hypothetical protein